MFAGLVRIFDRCVRCQAVTQSPPGIEEGDLIWCRKCWELELARRASEDIWSDWFDTIETDATAMLTVNHDEHYPWG